jgi:CDP-diglyceride synthetase
MSSELTKRIFTSIILLVSTFSYLVYANVDYFLYFIIFLGIFCCCEWIVMNSLLLKKFNKSFFKYFSIYLFGFIYFILIVPLSTFYLRVEVSLNFFLLILIICIFSDIGGYVFGKTIGGKKLTKISPNKTISGSIGSFIFSIFPIIFINLSNVEESFLEFNLINIIFSLFVSLICQLGDLFFSYFKRLNNKKNTSNLLPGHGGLLDRIDGIVIVFPNCFFN